MPRRSVQIALAVAVFGLLDAGGQPLHAESTCRAPADALRLAAPLPALSATLRASDAPVRIVALGSSSTEGAGASAANHSYPAQLQSELRRLYPGRQIEVVNRGKGGQLAADMLARLDGDVLAERPQLVIWQTGVNDAIRNVDVARFRAQVEDGIARIRAHGIDVVLIDQQYYPKAAKVPGYKVYLDVTRDIGQRHGVAVFRRHALMKHLVESAQYKVEDLLAPDQFHQNDVSYRCLATSLADALRASVAAADVARTRTVPAAAQAAQAVTLPRSR